MPSAQIADSSAMTDPLRGAVEIIPDRLYYAAFKAHPSTFPRPSFKSSDGKVNRPIHYFCVDNELVYWNFFLDFGPLNLGQMYRFCVKLNYKLKNDPALSKKTICFFSGVSPNKRANAVFLICAWMVLYFNKSPEEALRFCQTEIKSLPSFHDASPCKCTYKLTVLDCLKGMEKARMYGFFDYEKFDVDEYEHYEQVENGDLNWIAQGKILAFAGPHSRREMSREGYYTLTPEDYIPYFQQKNVGLVVRLNRKQYHEEKFINARISHVEQYYLDGSCPPMHILQKVLAAFESVPEGKGFAVHCKAGLGRTGTCIGAYMMKHYKFTAAEAIGWMRICRPGMVIGPQQHFLKDIEDQMWHEGELMTQKPRLSLVIPNDETHYGKKGKSRRSHGILSKLQFGSLSVDDQEERLNGRPGQADGLLERRMQTRIA